jgi:protein SCO1
VGGAPSRGRRLCYAGWVRAIGLAMTEAPNPASRLRQIRILLWLLVGLALAGTAFLMLVPRYQTATPATSAAQTAFGGPFALVGADGKPFSSIALAGKPFAIYFGYTRCGDVCPTTLARLVKLRKQAAGEGALNIVFVTIDPQNDGPKEVGQYAGLFNSPIIGLTGTPAQIDRVKKQYGIYAKPEPMTPGHDMMIDHTATVLLFDRGGKLAGTIATDEPDNAALAKLRRVIA